MEGALVRCQRQDLTAAEVRAHLKAGKVAHQVAVTFDDRVVLRPWLPTSPFKPSALRSGG